MRIGNIGQSLLESTLVLALATPLFLGGATLVRGFGDRLQCAQHVFEQTRAAAEGSPTDRSSKVTIYREAGWTYGSGYCGRAREQFAFPDLENWEP